MNDLSDTASGIAARAVELRLAFDRTFAEPVTLEPVAREPVLVIRVGAQDFAVRLSEIGGLFADKKITPVPGSHAALLGIAGFRGAIVPVYDLRMLIEHHRSQLPRWLAITAGAPVALAFDELKARLRVHSDAILPRPAGPERRSYAPDLVQSRKFVGPILHLPSLLEAIRTSRFEAAPREEQ